MSRSTPVCQLFCAKCKKRSRETNLRHYERNNLRDYMDIRIIGRKGDKARCRCGKCGYEYLSSSNAAIRRLDQHERLIARTQPTAPPHPEKSK